MSSGLLPHTDLGGESCSGGVGQGLDAAARAGGMTNSLEKPYDEAYDSRKEAPMKTLTATQARSSLDRLLDEAADSHEPVQITGQRSNAVLISEDDWNAVQETLYLLSIPGMRGSIRKGLATPLEETSEDPGW